MDTKDVPVSVMVDSFLKAMMELKAETTVVYFTAENNARRKANIVTNRGEDAIKRGLAILHKSETKNFEAGAKAIHSMCNLGVVKAPLRCSLSNEPWEKLGQQAQNEHIAATRVVVEAVLSTLGENAGNSASSLIV